jgi:hypothetical protein
MSICGDFIDCRPFRGVLPNPEKGDFVPSAKLTRKKVTFGLIWTSHNQDKRAFWQPLTRKNVTGEQGER